MEDTGKTIALIKALGGGGSGGLPPVTESDAGKVLAVDNSGVWGAQEPIGKKFIVTLTPTALDYSGTMDKTVAEINAAYEAGQEIWFNVRLGENVTLMSHVNEIYSETAYLYPSFQANAMVNNSTFLKAYTGTTDTGTGTSYYTMVYTPTPAT